MWDKARNGGECLTNVSCDVEQKVPRREHPRVSLCHVDGRQKGVSWRRGLGGRTGRAEVTVFARFAPSLGHLPGEVTHTPSPARPTACGLLLGKRFQGPEHILLKILKQFILPA